MAREGIPLDGLTFRFFLWVLVPILWCIGGVTLVYLLDVYTGNVDGLNTRGASMQVPPPIK